MDGEVVIFVFGVGEVDGRTMVLYFLDNLKSIFEVVFFLILAEPLPESLHFLVLLPVGVFVLFAEVLEGFDFLGKLGFFLLISFVCLFAHPVHFPDFDGKVFLIVFEVFLFAVEFVDVAVEGEDHVLGFFEVGKESGFFLHEAVQFGGILVVCFAHVVIEFLVFGVDVLAPPVH